MGAGMAEFASSKKVDSIADWNLYCYYVAGLVGIGLCRLFAASGLERRFSHLRSLIIQVLRYHVFRTWPIQWGCSYKRLISLETI
jgi:phytoene/squalene synthetase